MLFYPIGCTPASNFAAKKLEACGLPLTDHPCPEVTHLLLDAPSFSEPGKLRCGMDIRSVLSMLPSNITIIGGNLEDDSLVNYPKIDLLKDEEYLAQNAVITAHCALSIAATHLNTILPDTHILILGWGRIGKLLSRLLQNSGCTPTVYARNRKDRAMIAALGYPALSSEVLPEHLGEFQLIINTVPAPVIDSSMASLCSNCLKLELASVPGIAGTDVISAKGLPGKLAPESSGNLIAATLLRYLEGQI